MKKNIGYSLLLVLTSFIWGIAFVAQSSGGDAVGPYSFNCIRSFIGFLVLIPIIKLLDKIYDKQPPKGSSQKTLIIGGVLCGIILFVASNLQQLGITYGDSVGKAGFLTACYIIFVPIIGLFINKKCTINIWIGMILTVIGLYLLCINGKFKLSYPDILLILCAIVFAIHILVIDKFGADADSVRMSCIQFLVCGILTSVPMFFFEIHDNTSSWFSSLSTPQAWIPIIYAGIFSCGAAYTLQIVAQPKLNPTVASLILSLESVFSVLAGWMILSQQLSLKEISGCILIFIAVILAQI